MWQTKPKTQETINKLISYLDELGYKKPEISAGSGVNYYITNNIGRSLYLGHGYMECKLKLFKSKNRRTLLERGYLEKK